MDLMKDFDHRRGGGHIKDPEREIWQASDGKSDKRCGREGGDCTDGRQMTNGRAG